MSERHALSTEGSWVELRDPTELLAGDRADIEDAVTGPGHLKIQREMTDGIIIALVVNWSIQLPIPTQDPKVLRMLSIPDYLLLKKLVGPAEDIIFPADPEPKEPEVLAAAKADPASPTGDAAAS